MIIKQEDPNRGYLVEDPPKSTDTLTRLAARRLDTIKCTTLTKEVRNKAILCLIDYLGALVSGLSTAWAPSLLQYAKAFGVSGEGAQIMGVNMLAPAEVAAFTNAAIAHSVIRDDMHLGAGAHIGVMVIPAALALAQREGWTGELLLKGVVAGYEMATLLGVAVRQSGTVNPHLRPSGIVGAFAAAAPGIVADHGVSTTVAENALSLASNMAAGLNEWPWAGGLEINTHMGTASRAGIASLDLARAGITSSATVLEGRDGLFVAYGCGDSSAATFRERLATTSVGDGILEVKFKPVAGCNLIQTPVAVAAVLHQRVVGSLLDICAVHIATTTAAKTYPGCDNCGPFDSVQQTKMSLQYGVSAALLFGRVDEAVYFDMHNPEVRVLVSKCIIETEADYDRALAQGEQPCRIKVHMRDGTIHEHSMADVPWLDGVAVMERFRNEAAAVFDQDTIDNIITECRRLEDRESCVQLTKLLSSQRSFPAHSG